MAKNGTKKSPKKALRLKTVCFTGHRPKNLKCKYDKDHPQYKYIKAMITQVLKRCLSHGIDTFIVGMALGFDQWVLECLLELRALGAEFKVFAQLPCVGQEKPWPKPSQDHYHSLLKAVDGIKYSTEGTYDEDKACMDKRNEDMVNASCAVIALYDLSKTSGGTYKCVVYALKHGVPVFRIDPDEETEGKKNNYIELKVKK